MVAEDKGTTLEKPQIFKKHGTIKRLSNKKVVEGNEEGIQCHDQETGMVQDH